ASRVERPRDRRSVPEHEEPGEDEERETGRIELRPRKRAEERRGDRRRRREHDRRPEPGEREVARAAAEEERPEEEGRHAAGEDTRRDRERPEPRGRDFRSRAHGREASTRVRRRVAPAAFLFTNALQPNYPRLTARAEPAPNRTCTAPGTGPE